MASVVRVGRYFLLDQMAGGGMATVHFGRLVAPGGFTRTVAIKRLRPQFAKDPDFASMFVDEARLAACIQHPNVVATLDVATVEREMLLVMEYVAGATLAQLVREVRQRGDHAPIAIVASIVGAALLGLHAAHEAVDDRGQALNLVHRDFSPQNVLVGGDGVARVADFGIAKAAGRLVTTRDNVIKGKCGYMAPEQIRGRPVDRRTDIHAAGVVLWEALTGERLFVGGTPSATLNAVLESPIPAPRSVRQDVPVDVDTVVMRALDRDPSRRFATAREMAVALEHAVPMASSRAISEWVDSVVGPKLRERAAHVRALASVATDPGAVRAPRHRRAFFAVAIAAGVLVSVAIAYGRGRHRPTPPPSPSNVSTYVASVPSPHAPDSVMASAPLAVTSTPSPPPTPRAARVHAAPTSTCAPPYTVDGAGIRHWKEGC